MWAMGSLSSMLPLMSTYTTDRLTSQLALLAGLLKEKYPRLELGSVDGFQGREKEAVVVSTVRSNSEHEVGFLGEKRRLNVAMTRPKRHLCVIGDSDTIRKYVHPSLHRLHYMWR